MTKALDPSARYIVVDEIASGGMGAVFLALQTDESGRHTPVAIKKLHAHLAEDASTVDAFVDEARIAYRLRHPNVVRVHDVVPIDGQLVIVMDWVEGVALRNLIKGRSSLETTRGGKTDKADKGPVLPIPVIRRLLVDALEGLHAAHELKDDRGTPLDIVHRDISPQNLLVGTDGLTRVTDFGIALAKGRLAPTTVQGGVKGKIPYLSPEQVNRSKIDRRSDVFAAGVVAWELLTGQRLFVAPSEGEIMAMILREPLQPPSALRLDVPLDLDETVLRALERKVDRRFATAADFARAIADGGPLASHEEVGRIVATTAGTTLVARRQKLASAAERGAARPLEEEMTATFVQPIGQPSAPPRLSGHPISIPPAPSAPPRLSGPPPPITPRISGPPPPPAPSARPSRIVVIETPAIDPTGVATSLPPPPAIAGRSTTPLLIAVVLALGLAIVLVVKYTGQPEPPPTRASFPAAPIIPPPEQRGGTEPSAPTPAAPTPIVPEPESTIVELGPTPVSRPAHRPTSHGKRDAGAARAGQPFMPDDL